MQSVSIVRRRMVGIVSLVAGCLSTGCRSTPPPRHVDAPAVTVAELRSQESKALAAVKDNPHIPALMKPKLLGDVRLRYEQNIAAMASKREKQ